MLGLCSDVEPVLGLFADHTLVGSTVGGLGDTVRPGLWIVGKEWPKEAAGSWVLEYFCQIPFGRSRQLWQLSDGGFVVEFVFVLTADPTVSPAHGNTAGSCSFLEQNSQQTPKSSPWLFVAVTRVSVCINTPWIVGAHHLDPSILE